MARHLQQSSFLPLPVKLQVKRKQILAIARKYGARNVRIFGSVTRGEARPDNESDRERLLDIFEAIERIDAHKGGLREDFDSDIIFPDDF